MYVVFEKENIYFRSTPWKKMDAMLHSALKSQKNTIFGSCSVALASKANINLFLKRILNGEVSQRSAE